MSNAFMVGDTVRVILDQDDPDQQFHDRKGEIVDIAFDDAESVTGDSEDNFMYTVRFDDGEEPDVHFRRNDLVLIERRA